MQESDRLLAQRYAQALFDAAKAAKEEDHVRLDLAEGVRKLRDQESLFMHPMLPAEEKKKLARKVMPQAAASSLRFLDLLIEKKRWALLSVIAAGFEKVLDQHRGVVRAQVRSATALAEGERERLRQGLEKFSGKTVQLEVREDPALIGGLIVKMGDWVLDASFTHRLQQLRESIN